MLRLAVLALILVASGTAAADPIAQVVLSPQPDWHEGDHYYVLANLTTPQGPEFGKDRACSPPGSTPPDPVAAGQGVVAPFLASPVGILHEGSLEPYAPRCVTVALGTCTPIMACPQVGTASYDVATGDYNLVLEDLPVTTGQAHERSASNTMLSGNSGAELTADCNGCPPPIAV